MIYYVYLMNNVVENRDAHGIVGLHVHYNNNGVPKMSSKRVRPDDDIW